MDEVPIFAFRRNLVVAASAGTGKTHALVGVLVHVLLGASELGKPGNLTAPVDPARIIATTFSRKAAREIRERLTTELERLGDGDPAARYRADLAAACARAGQRPWSDARIKERARRALGELDRLTIGTVHSVAAGLVKNHAFELGMSPAAETADEDAARTRSDDAIVRVLERHAGTSGLVAELAERAGGVDRLVAQISDTLLDLDEYGGGACDLEIDDGDAGEIEKTFGALVDIARGMAQKPRVRDVVQALELAYRREDRAALEEAVCSLFAVRIGKDAAPEEEALADFRDVLPGTTHRERARRFVRTWANRHRFTPVALEARRLLALCETECREEARRTSAPGFTDLLRMARDLLRDHPDVASEVGSALDVLLVDEFQDTSRLQRDVVLLLWARNDKRERGRIPPISELRPHGLLVVGDRKQSIYGFRGADVSVFAEFCVGLAGAPARRALAIAERVAWEPAQPLADFVALRHNRRGKQELLAFANAFSARRFRPAASPAALYEIEYVPKTEDLVSPTHADETHANRTTWLRVTGDGETSTRLEEAGVIASTIARLVADARAKYRDIAVLAQSHEMLDAASFALARAAIPYVACGRGFFAAREVRDLVAMLELIHDPTNKWALVQVLRGPWAGVSNETLVGLTDFRRGLAELGPAWDAGERRALISTEEHAAVRAVRDVVLTIRPSAGRLGPAGVLREAMRALAFEETLLMLSRGAQRVANVRKFVSMAERETSIEAFLARLERASRGGESEATTFSEEDDAVRLLTVHASKGLDFRIVFVPQVGAAPPPPAKPVLLIEPPCGARAGVLAMRLGDGAEPLEPPSYRRAHFVRTRRQRAESERLAYVAITRAAHAMYLVGRRNPPKSAASETYHATSASVLNALAENEDLLRTAALSVEDVGANEADAPLEACAHLSNPAPSPVPVPVPMPAPDAAPARTWRSLSIAPTALQDFAHCARRFQLAHLVEVREHPGGAHPGANLRAPVALRDHDPRTEGTLMHRVLERVDAAAFGAPDALEHVTRALAREGVSPARPEHARIAEKAVRFLRSSYAAQIARARASIVRERAFSLRIEHAGDRTFVLSGSIDLVILWPDGPFDVVDYKHTGGDGAPAQYAVQLAVYMLAARTLFPNRSAARAGVAFLGAERCEPKWYDLHEDAIARELTSLAGGLFDARTHDAFPRAPVTRCREIRCGYFAPCYASGAPTTAR